MEIAIHFELRRDARDEISAADYLEIIDLRTSGPTDDQLLAFKISDSAQERPEEVLRKYSHLLHLNRYSDAPRL